MRSLLQTMINALLSADADAVVGAEWGQPSADRLTRRTDSVDIFPNLDAHPARRNSPAVESLQHVIFLDRRR